MGKDYKPTSQNYASQDSLNNNEWSLLQTSSGAIAVIVIALAFTFLNLYRG